MMNDDFYKNLGQNIKHKRKKFGLTQQDLSDKIGVTLNHVGKIEVAYSKPSLDMIIKIANALNITVSELCNFD